MGERPPRHRPRQPVAGHADPVRARPVHGPVGQARRQCVRLRVPGGNSTRPTRSSEKQDGATGDRQDQQICPQLQRHPDPSHHIRAVPHEHDARARRPATSARGCCILGPPPGTIDGNARLRQAFSWSGAVSCRSEAGTSVPSRKPLRTSRRHSSSPLSVAAPGVDRREDAKPDQRAEGDREDRCDG